jgi:tRNA(fMet)-specific endonuclease VapC
VNAVVVDTNVISYYLKGDSRMHLYDPHLEGKTLLASFQTVAELAFWRKRDGWGSQREALFQKELARYQIIYPTQMTCEIFAEANYEARRAGRPIPLGDAWIAAVALELEVPLVTHNRSDFLGVLGLEIISENKS